MGIIWAPQAEEDREKIFERIANDNLSAADALDQRFMDLIGDAAFHPKMHPGGLVPDTREIHATPNYIVVFRELPNGDIEVIKIRHARQRWP